MLIYLLITNMGTLLSVQELMKQWKTILISLSGIMGIVVILFGIGTLLFDIPTVLVAIPPLVGGIVSALIMSEGAAGVGNGSIGLRNCNLRDAGVCRIPADFSSMKKEGKMLLKKYRNGELAEKIEVKNELVQPELKLFSKMPKKYNTDYFKFFRLAIVGYLAYLTSELLSPLLSISPYVVCLLFGVIATSVGFLERQVLQKANGFGFAILGLSSLY